MEHGPTGCDAPTIQESGLQAVVVQAINIALGNRESMMATFWENVEAVIRQEDATSSEGIEVKLLERRSTEVTEYYELLVRWLIEKVTVYDERFEVEFKSGAKVDVER